MVNSNERGDFISPFSTLFNINEGDTTVNIPRWIFIILITTFLGLLTLFVTLTAFSATRTEYIEKKVESLTTNINDNCNKINTHIQVDRVEYIAILKKLNKIENNIEKLRQEQRNLLTRLLELNGHQ